MIPLGPSHPNPYSQHSPVEWFECCAAGAMVVAGAAGATVSVCDLMWQREHEYPMPMRTRFLVRGVVGIGVGLSMMATGSWFVWSQFVAPLTETTPHESAIR